MLFQGRFIFEVLNLSPKEAKLWFWHYKNLETPWGKSAKAFSMQEPTHTPELSQQFPVEKIKSLRVLLSLGPLWAFSPPHPRPLECNRWARESEVLCNSSSLHFNSRCSITIPPRLQDLVRVGSLTEAAHHPTHPQASLCMSAARCQYLLIHGQCCSNNP